MKGGDKMEKPASFLKALMTLMLPGESMGDFRTQYRTLTDDDKSWFRERFKTEYGWEWDAVA